MRRETGWSGGCCPERATLVWSDLGRGRWDQLLSCVNNNNIIHVFQMDFVTQQMKINLL